MSEICDTHKAAASSVFNFAFAHNKKIINLDSVCNASNRMNDINCYTQETNNGVEDSASFWMRVWGLNTLNEFKNLIEIDRLDKFKKTNSSLLNIVRKNTIDFDWDLKCLLQPKKEYGELINMFDEYNLDEKASSRIINFLK